MNIPSPPANYVAERNEPIHLTCREPGNREFYNKILPIFEKQMANWVADCYRIGYTALWYECEPGEHGKARDLVASKILRDFIAAIEEKGWNVRCHYSEPSYAVAHDWHGIDLKSPTPANIHMDIWPKA